MKVGVLMGHGPGYGNIRDGGTEKRNRVLDEGYIVVQDDLDESLLYFF